MAAKQEKSKQQTLDLDFIRKLAAAVSLLVFVVVVVGGLMAEARIFTITLRAFVAMVLASLITRIIISVIVTYEEMNSGKV